MTTKFRAWHKTGEEMGRIAFIRYKESGEIVHLSFRRNIYNGNIYGGLVKLDEIELMQSTGLEDKNGKEIFEGDIISDGHMSRGIRHHQTLGFYTIDGSGVEGFFGDTASLEDFEEVSKYTSENIEIIGNIYENPELLEVEE